MEYIAFGSQFRYMRLDNHQILQNKLIRAEKGKKGWWQKRGFDQENDKFSFRSSEFEVSVGYQQETCRTGRYFGFENRLQYITHLRCHKGKVVAKEHCEV